MNRFVWVGAAALASVVMMAPAHAATFTVAAGPGFSDSFLGLTEAGLALSGTFDATDTNGDELLQASEITAYNLMVSGFTDNTLDFSVTDGDAGAMVTTTLGGVTNDIDDGPGVLNVGLIEFSNFIGIIQLSLDIPTGTNYGAGVFNFGDLNFGFYETDNLTINGQSFPALIPLPATLPLVLAGLGAFGVVARRRKSA